MKFLWGFVLAALLIGSASHAEDRSGPLESWLKEMRETLERVVPKKAPSKNTTAVSGVRSADQNSEDAVYWKGKKEDVAEEELADFRAAFDLAEKGQREGSIRAFEDFLKRHPSGALSGDAKTAIQKLKSS